MSLSLAWRGRDAGRPRRPRLLVRFTRSESGALAVEFGLIAPFFFGLLFGILEVALTFWSTQVLETAVANAARQIYTGSFQQGAVSMSQTDALAKFKDLVCANVTAVFNCKSLVRVDVQKFTSYSATTITVPVKNGAFDTSGFGYNPPGPNEICVVRAAMEYPVYVNIFGYKTGLANGNRLIMASSTFRTEPYQ
ncbi:TadE/TadG family type IV pilus assembly protein [Enterovirga aerilata]|uniref:Pilus assembly protein n=1 Tax=Enterovirga aerilata TaxID=2730920 RepID=A0A849IER6_9HYPH|nr:TadE/TadG family type IV pilus assembly protein [Enterovirga sp. DB1703]NNM74939.1 pilus assembly protein [Enterovirga sp. DB1703]